MLFSCSAEDRTNASEPLFGQFLEGVFSEVRLNILRSSSIPLLRAGSRNAWETSFR